MAILTIGIDPGEWGAIAAIDQYLAKSAVIPMPPFHPWTRPTENFYKVGQKKGNRKHSPHKEWGRGMLDPMEIVSEVTKALGMTFLEEELQGLTSWMEEPGAQGGGRNSFSGSMSVGGESYLTAYAMQLLTGKLPWRCTPQQWQRVAGTYGRADWEHGAMNIPDIIRQKGKFKGEVNERITAKKRAKVAKKHNSITTANEIFSKSISYEKAGEKKGKDGYADALLIGLYGALFFPAVVRMSPFEAWFVLNSEKALTIPLDTDIPFKEVLVYADTYDRKRDGAIAEALTDHFEVELPRPEDLKQGGIVGYVTTDGVVRKEGKDWELPEQVITSRQVYSEAVSFEMGARTVAFFENKLPHLI